MLRRLWTSLRRDNLINWRNYYYLVVVLVAMIYLVSVRWLIPQDASIEPDLYVVDLTSDGRFAAFVQRQTEASAPAKNAYLLDTEDALRQKMRDNRYSLGVVLEEGTPLPRATLYFQGHENPKVRNLLAAAIESELRDLYGRAYPSQVSVREHILRGKAEAGGVPLNIALVPFLLFSDAAMIGMLFIAALVFMEKEEGTLRAYLVTPGYSFEYLLSKALSLAFLSVIFTLILVPPTIGWGPNYVQLSGVMVLGSIFVSLLGALVALHFDNFSQFLFPAIVLMIVLGVPGIAYWIPSFSPVWLQWLPTYPLIFSLREATFPTGSPGVVRDAMLFLLLADAALLVTGGFVFNRQMARG